MISLESVHSLEEQLILHQCALCNNRSITLAGKAVSLELPTCSVAISSTEQYSTEQKVRRRRAHIYGEQHAVSVLPCFSLCLHFTCWIEGMYMQPKVTRAHIAGDGGLGEVISELTVSL